MTSIASDRAAKHPDARELRTQAPESSAHAPESRARERELSASAREFSSEVSECPARALEFPANRPELSSAGWRSNSSWMKIQFLRAGIKDQRARTQGTWTTLCAATEIQSPSHEYFPTVERAGITGARSGTAGARAGITGAGARIGYTHSPPHFPHVEIRGASHRRQFSRRRKQFRCCCRDADSGRVLGDAPEHT
jgi:hypothetical protein